MKNIDNLCNKCFQELTNGAVCEACGYDNETATDFSYLAPKTVLADNYAVGTLLQHESDAAVYSGYDCRLEKKVIIREFYPKGFANRLEGSKELRIRQKYIPHAVHLEKSFYSLWTTLEKMHSLSAVVPVYDVFEENETTYAVIEHLEAIPLREYLLRNEEGFISWDTARLMFMPVLTTIEALHENGKVHGAITPDSLLLCRDGKMRLSPFCIQECIYQNTPLEFVENEGYTALEQYDNPHKICPSTDIYAFSACIYRALVGTNPPSALAREANDKLMIPNAIAEKIPMHVIKALGSGLQVYPEKRIKNIADFRELLDAAPSVKAQSSGVMTQHVVEQEKPANPTAYPDPPSDNKKARATIIVLTVLILLAIGVAIYFAVFTDVFRPAEPSTTLSAQLATYQVPNFANNGYTQSDIENNGAWNEQFNLTFTNDYSTDVEEGIIFKQSVAAGETVDAGTEIILTVSKGIQTQEVPDVSGKTLEEATKILEDLGFKVSSVEVYNDGSHIAQTVKTTYASAPQAGAVVAVGEEIILQVYGEVQTTQPTTESPQE